MLSLVSSDSPPVSKLLLGPEPVSRVSDRSLRSSPVTASVKTIVIEPTGVLRGSGEMFVMSAVGAVVSTDHVSDVLLPRMFAATSMMPDDAAVSVSKYVPCVPVRPLKLPSVKVTPPSLLLSVCEPVSKLLPPLRVSVRSARSKPVIASLKVIVSVLTDVLRGSGVTSSMIAPGAVLSSDQVRVASLSSALLDASMMSESAAISVSKYVPCRPVRLVRLPSVQVVPPSLDDSVCEPVSRFALGPEPVSRVSVRSLRSKPVIGVLKVIVTELTALLRGLVTVEIVAVGAVVSTVQVSVAFVVSALLAVSRMLDPLAVSVSE